MQVRAAKFSIITGAIIAATSTNAHAYCAGWDKSWPNYTPNYYSVRNEFHRSQWVIKAKVFDERWIGEDGKEKPLQPPFQSGQPRPWGFDPYLGAFYKLRVERSFKGTPPPIIRVFSENATDRFWLKPGEEILAFVSTGQFEAPIGNQPTLDTCGNFQPFPKANKILPAVLSAARHSN